MKTKKQLIHLTESDLHRVIKESVNKVLREGTIPKNVVLDCLKEYIEVSNGELETVMKEHPQLVDVIANWLLENGEREFIRYVLTNFLDAGAYLD